MKLSVIIPVYNAQDYLERCLGSITADASRDLEIIAVNDGSKDNSLAILEKLQAADSRIIVIDQVNSGVSSARNKGIMTATGDYVTFMDADDYYLGHIYQFFYKTITKSPDFDVAVFGFSRHVGDIVKDVFQFTTDEIMSLDAFYDNFADHYGKGFLSSACNKIYRRSLILNNQLFFNQQFKIGEDLMFNLKLFPYCHTVVYATDVMYAYERGNQVSASRRMKGDEWINQLNLLDQVETFINDHAISITDNYKKRVENVVINCLSYAMQADNSFMIIKRVVNDERYLSYVASLKGFRSKYSSLRWLILNKWAVGVYLLMVIKTKIRK